MLARVWYMTSTPPRSSMAKPIRSPSGTVPVTSNPNRSSQNGRHGSISATYSTTVPFFISMSLHPGSNCMVRGPGCARHHLRSAPPHVKPEPKAVRHTRSPSAIRPSSTASWRAIGMLAAVVFP